jgi:hypothetical protein
MDQISIKTPNPKCQLFLKIDQQRYLAAGVYLSEAPYPLPLCYTLYEYIPLYLFLFTQGRGGGWGIGEPVRRLEGPYFTRGVDNTNMTYCAIYKLY